MLVATSVGCGSAQVRSSALFDTPDAKAAAERAPDLYLMAEEAQKDADDAQARGQDKAAADHRTRARLLLAAAIAEGERLALEEERMRLETNARDLEKQVARKEAARLEQARAKGRAQAAVVARAQVRRALAQAEEDETRRARAKGNETERLHRQAEPVLRERALLLVAAAAALGGEPKAAERLREELLSSPPSDPTDAMRRADALYAEALGLLGRARAARGAVSAEERHSLREAADELGFHSNQLDRGVGIDLEAFVGRNEPAPAKIERLTTLLRAHPHGPVRLELFGPRKEASALEARARSIQKALIDSGIDEGRLQIEIRSTHPKESIRRGGLAIWLAYGSATDPSVVTIPGRARSRATSAPTPTAATPIEAQAETPNAREREPQDE